MVESKAEKESILVEDDGLYICRGSSLKPGKQSSDTIKQSSGRRVTVALLDGPELVLF